MNTQKFFSILGESFLNALVFLLIFNGFTAWVYHVNYFGAWEHSVSFAIGYFSGVFGYNIFKAKSEVVFLYRKPAFFCQRHIAVFKFSPFKPVKTISNAFYAGTGKFTGAFRKYGQNLKKHTEEKTAGNNRLLALRELYANMR